MAMRTLIENALSPDSVVRPLAARYERAAAGWHEKIARLGYLTAYEQVCAHLASGHAAAYAGRAVRVLDAGAGTGGLTLAFARRWPGPVEAALLDLSAAMLDRAGRHLAAAGLDSRAICAPVSREAVRPGAYDVILCSHLVEHLDDPVDALTTLRAGLAPAGVLLLVASKPHWCTSLLRIIWRHRALRETAVLELLATAGFREVERFPFAAGPPSRTSMAYIAWR